LRGELTGCSIRLPVCRRCRHALQFLLHPGHGVARLPDESTVLNLTQPCGASCPESAAYATIINAAQSCLRFPFRQVKQMMAGAG
jgi:hypothetical protein